MASKDFFQCTAGRALLGGGAVRALGSMLLFPVVLYPETSLFNSQPHLKKEKKKKNRCDPCAYLFEFVSLHFCLVDVTWTPKCHQKKSLLWVISMSYIITSFPLPDFTHNCIIRQRDKLLMYNIKTVTSPGLALFSCWPHLVDYASRTYWIHCFNYNGYIFSSSYRVNYHTYWVIYKHFYLLCSFDYSFLSNYFLIILICWLFIFLKWYVKG